MLSCLHDFEYLKHDILHENQASPKQCDSRSQNLKKIKLPNILSYENYVTELTILFWGEGELVIFCFQSING